MAPYCLSCSFVLRSMSSVNPYLMMMNSSQQSVGCIGLPCMHQSFHSQCVCSHEPTVHRQLPEVNTKHYRSGTSENYFHVQVKCLSNDNNDSLVQTIVHNSSSHNDALRKSTAVKSWRPCTTQCICLPEQSKTFDHPKMALSIRWTSRLSWIYKFLSKLSRVTSSQCTQDHYFSSQQRPCNTIVSHLRYLILECTFQVLECEILIVSLILSILDLWAQLAPMNDGPVRAQQYGLDCPGQ